MAKFMRKGTTTVAFLPTVAAPATPTQAELTAGTVLSTTLLADITGFDVKNTLIDTPSFGSVQTSKIPGEQTSDDSTFVFYEDTTTNPFATLLARSTVGWILIANNGVTTAGSKVRMFPVQVSSNTPAYSSGNEAAKYTVTLAITDVPTESATMGA